MRSVDIGTMRSVYRGCGSKPYPPELMLAIALYCLLQGVSSPARWYEAARTVDQCKFLGRGIAPARSIWYEFRDRSAKFIEAIHQQLIHAAVQQNQYTPTECSLDGTFTRAAASRHYLPNREQLEKRTNKLKEAIEVLGDKDLRHNDDPGVPKFIARTSEGRELQLQRLQHAQAELNEKIHKNAAKPKRYQVEEKKIRISPADPDAALGRDKEKVFCPLYNTQYMVSCENDVIVAYGVWAQTNDSGMLVPMIERTQAIVGASLKTVHADTAYCSLLELRDSKALGINLMAPVQEASKSSKKAVDGEPQFSQQEFTFSTDLESCTCPAGHKMKTRSRGPKPRADGRVVYEVRFGQSAEVCSECPLAKRCLQPTSKRRTVSRMEGQNELDAQKEKMESDEGKRSQRIRGQTVERSFADGKRNRNQGQQNGRGLRRVRAEVGLLVVAQNSLTIYNHKRNAEI